MFYVTEVVDGKPEVTKTLTVLIPESSIFPAGVRTNSISGEAERENPRHGR